MTQPIREYNLIFLLPDGSTYRAPVLADDTMTDEEALRYLADDVVRLLLRAKRR